MVLNDLISETDWADERGCSVRTIQRERSLRIGPPFIRLGKKIYYRKAAICDWLLAQEQEQVRAPKKSEAA